MAGVMLGAVGHAQDAGWELRHDTPGAPSCRAVKLGASVDMQLLRNRENGLVLVAGHPDWSYEGEPFPVEIAIDGAPPAASTGFPLGRVVMMRIDAALLQRLRTARTLDLKIRDGRFHADISGLGPAFDAIAVCPG